MQNHFGTFGYSNSMDDVVARYTIKYENQSKLMNLGYDLGGCYIHQQDLHSARAQGQLKTPTMAPWQQIRAQEWLPWCPLLAMVGVFSCPWAVAE